MCGILFWVLEGLDEEAVRIIETVHAQKVQHRGTDGTRLMNANGCLHAFHRLAIINVNESGMQPFVEGEDVLIGTGEVWNYQELDADVKSELKSDVKSELKSDVKSELKSDVEVFLRMEMTADQIDRVDGDFAFVRSAPGRFWAARDVAGVRPLFYATDASQRPIAFASEAKALVAGPGVAKVHVFPPGHVYDSAVDALVPYHTRPIERQVRSLLTLAVTKRLIHSDRPVGILCSGGVDSAIITSIAARLRTPSLVHVFTMEYENSGSQDAFYARMLCQFHGFQHTVVSFSAAMAQASIREVIGITETYDPNTIRAAIPMFLLAKHIAEQTDIKVILSGEGADELFAGYLYFMGAPSSDDLNRESRRLLGNLHMFDLLRADRCFAAFSLEVRVPYLDKDLVDYVTCVQGHSKRFRNGAEKMLLRDAFENLQELKDLRILERPKERFSDGCGFSYVPDLLNYVSDGAPRLQEKLEKEKQYYLAIFDELYTEDNRHWITSRELPAWASGKVQDVGLDV